MLTDPADTAQVPKVTGNRMVLVSKASRNWLTTPAVVARSGRFDRGALSDPRKRSVFEPHCCSHQMQSAGQPLPAPRNFPCLAETLLRVP